MINVSLKGSCKLRQKQYLVVIDLKIISRVRIPRYVNTNCTYYSILSFLHKKTRPVRTGLYNANEYIMLVHTCPFSIDRINAIAAIKVYVFPCACHSVPMKKKAPEPGSGACYIQKFLPHIKL